VIKAKPLREIATADVMLITLRVPWKIVYINLHIHKTSCTRTDKMGVEFVQVS